MTKEQVALWHKIKRLEKEQRKEKSLRLLSNETLCEHAVYAANKQIGKYRDKTLFVNKQAPKVEVKAKGYISCQGQTTKGKVSEIQHEFLIRGDNVTYQEKRDTHNYRAKDFVKRYPNVKNHPGVFGESYAVSVDDGKGNEKEKKCNTAIKPGGKQKPVNIQKVNEQNSKRLLEGEKHIHGGFGKYIDGKPTAPMSDVKKLF